VDVFEADGQVALLFVNEASAVRDEQFHVSGLRMVNGGVVNLVEDAVRDGEPDAAGRGVCSAYRVLDAGSPAGLHARCAEGFPLLIEPSV